MTNWMGRSVSVIDTRTETRAAADPALPAEQPAAGRPPERRSRPTRAATRSTRRTATPTPSRSSTRAATGVVRTLHVGLGQRCAPGRDAQRASTSARTGGGSTSRSGARTRSPSSTSTAAGRSASSRPPGTRPTSTSPRDGSEARGHDRERGGTAAPLRRALRGRRLHHRRPRVRLRRDPAEHQGRHQRHAHAEEAQEGSRISRALVLRNNRVRARRAQKPPALGAIRHVIYVVKENRTYDQVLGRPRQGRRRSRAGPVRRGLRAQPPRARAPLHAVRQLLRRRRRLGRWPELDGGGGRHRLHRQDLADHLLARLAPAPPCARLRARRLRRPVLHRAARRSTRTVFRGAAAPTRGYLWDNAFHEAVSFRNYGMYTPLPGDCTGAGNTSTSTHLDDRASATTTTSYYAGFNLRCSDHAAAPARVGARVRRLRERVPRRSLQGPAAGALDPAAAQRPHVGHDARARRSRRATWPTTTSRSGRLVDGSPRARSGRTRRSW